MNSLLFTVWSSDHQPSLQVSDKLKSSFHYCACFRLGGPSEPGLHGNRLGPSSIPLPASRSAAA